MKYSFVKELYDIKTLANALYTITVIEEETLGDCTPEPDLMSICEFLESQGKVSSAIDLFTKASKSSEWTDIEKVIDVLGAKINIESPAYYYLSAEALMKTPAKIKQVFAIISEYDGINGVECVEGNEGRWEDNYSSYLDDNDYKDFQKWVKSPTITSPSSTKILLTSPPLTTPTISSSIPSGSAVSAPKVPENRARATFKIQF